MELKLPECLLRYTIILTYICCGFLCLLFYIYMLWYPSSQLDLQLWKLLGSCSWILRGWSYSAQVGMRIKLRLFVRAVSALDHWAFFPPTYTNILKNRFFKLLTLITVIFKSLRNFWFTKTLRKSPFPSNCMPFTCLCFLYFLLIYEAVLIISIMWDFLLDNHNCSDLKVAAAKLMKKRAVKPYEIIYVTMFIWKCCIIKTEMCRN